MLVHNRVLAKLERFRHAGQRAGVSAAFSGRATLEIGGPSSIFGRGGPLPIYPEVARLDRCNYATATIWNDQHPETPPGRVIVGEAADLPVADQVYDGLLASHVLEHVANALNALGEWQRVLAPGAPAVLIVPHKDYTFDHRRPVTALAHFEDDAARGIDESDLNHLPEVLALHDSRHDHFGGDAAAFRRRGEDNASVRALHHHVFTTASFFALLSRAGFVVTELFTMRPYHVAALCYAGDSTTPSVPSQTVLAQALCTSPFPSDRS